MSGRQIFQRCADDSEQIIAMMLIKFRILTKLEQMESASVILDRNGKIFGQIYVENRETVPYDQLPPDLINAVVAVEDANFYQHHGYDLFGIIRAALKNLTAGQVRQGPSTITQQLARNSFSLKEK